MSAWITAAVKRAAQGIGDATNTSGELWLDEAQMALTAALDVEEMARAADPQAFEDMDPTSNRAIALRYVSRRRSATEHAERIRTALLGADS